MRTALARLSLLVALAASAACVGGVEAQDTFQKTVETHGHLKLKISNFSGDTCIARSPTSSAVVSARVTVRAGSLDDAKAVVDTIAKHPPVVQEGDTLVVGKLDSEDFEKTQTWVEVIDVDYRVQVPEDTEIDAATLSGHTCVEDVAGPVHVGSTSGNVDVKNVSGAVEVEVISGDVALEHVQKATVRSTSGNITASRVAGPLDVKAISGDVRLSDVGEQLAARTTSGDIEVTGALGAKSDWQFAVVSGDLLLTLPEESAFHLEAKTTSGTVQSEFDIVTRQAGDDGVEGDVGQNPTARIRSESTSGDVHLHKQLAH